MTNNLSVSSYYNRLFFSLPFFAQEIGLLHKKSRFRSDFLENDD